MRIALIINPFASSADSRQRVQVQRILGSDHELSVIETTKGGHAIRLAYGVGRREAEDGSFNPEAADLVIALGGGEIVTVLANETYRQYFELRDNNVASAYAVFILLLSLASSVFYLRAMRSQNEVAES